MSTRINVDPANPGQFFACCGLLELAGRIWDGAEGWFKEGAFLLRPLVAMASEPTLACLVDTIAGCPCGSSISMTTFHLRLKCQPSSISGLTGGGTTVPAVTD